MSNKVGRFLVLFVFVTIACFGISAITAPQAHAACSSDATCTGHDPINTGCTNHVSIVARTVINVGNGSNLNDIYGSDCGSNWAQANIYYDYFNTYTLTIKRDAGGGLTNRAISASVSDCAAGCYGNMVYAPTQPTCAFIAGNYNSLACQPGFTNF